MRQKNFWTDWDEIFRVSSFWANLEMIKFWALNSQRGKIFYP